jgi:short-subunit dehydrogenase
MRSLKDLVVVITGAGQGIGAAITRHMSAEEAIVVLAGRTEKKLKKIAEELRTPEDRFMTAAADVTLRSGMNKIVNSTIKKFGHIDIFINNAGVGIHKPLVETSEKEFDTIFNTNLKAIYYSFLELIPIMKKTGGGQIINISSLAGRMGVAGLAAYSSSKAALNVLSEAVAGEVRNDNIKICVFSPASVSTNFMSNLSGKSKSPSRAAHKLTVDEVAEAIIFLARQNKNAWTSMADIRPLAVKK